MLAKAKSDGDFRGVASIDEARGIIGLPLVADTPIDALLLGYGGWWAGVDEGMMEGWIEMQFKPGGKVEGREHSGETGSWSPWSATWKVDGRTVIVTRGKRNVQTLKLEDCSGNSGVAGQQCFQIVDTAAWVAPGRS